MSQNGRDALIATVGALIAVGAIRSYGAPTWAAILIAVFAGLPVGALGRRYIKIDYQRTGGRSPK